MITQILTGTPHWVWFLLFGLLALGLMQTVTRAVPLRRVIILPLVMTGLSLSGTLSAFGGSGLLLWLASTLSIAWPLLRTLKPAGASFDATSGKFTVPGSWLPVLTMLALFVCKYSVAVTLAIRPQFSQDALFVFVVCAMYGFFSAVFMVRAINLLKLARSANGRAVSIRCGTGSGTARTVSD